jgi:hypothetical protein
MDTPYHLGIADHQLLLGIPAPEVLQLPDQCSPLNID